MSDEVVYPIGKPWSTKVSEVKFCLPADATYPVKIRPPSKDAPSSGHYFGVGAGYWDPHIGDFMIWLDGPKVGGAFYPLQTLLTSNLVVLADDLTLTITVQESDADRRKRLAGGCVCGVWLTGGLHYDGCKFEGQHSNGVYL